MRARPSRRRGTRDSGEFCCFFHSSNLDEQAWLLEEAEQIVTVYRAVMG